MSLELAPCPRGEEGTVPLVESGHYGLGVLAAPGSPNQGRAHGGVRRKDVPRPSFQGSSSDDPRHCPGEKLPLWALVTPCLQNRGDSL